MNLAVSCNDRVTQQYLEGDLGNFESDAFEKHLNVCEHCRSRLNEFSTQDLFWSTAQRYLSSVDDLPALTGEFGPGDVETLDASLVGRDVLRDIPLQPSDDPDMLGRFGGYEISGVVGRGGMGVVLKGWDRSLDRYVAIKVLSPTFAHLSPARQRFAREAKAAAAIVHDNIIAIFGVDQCNGLPYLVMPFVKGESLQKRIDREAPLPLEMILEIALQIARGLQAAHEQGVIHRDIKPANILLPQSVSRVLITDFGLARAADDATLTNSGLIAGTPAYMSPEQARGDGIDARSDLFSLGSVIYAMACGHPPFRAETTYGIMRRIIDENARPLKQLRNDVPHWFQSILDRLLAKQPQHRFVSAASCAEHLELCLKHVRDPSAQPLPKIKRPAEKTAWIAYSVIAILCAVLCCCMVWVGVIGVAKLKSTLNSSATTKIPSAIEPVSDDLSQDLEQLEEQIKQLEQELEE